MSAVAEATCALSSGTGDRTANDKYHFGAILRTVARGDMEEDAFEEVAIETR